MRIDSIRPKLRRDSRGAVSIEYALLGAFLGVSLLAALTSVKTSLNTDYKKVSNGLYSVTLPSPSWTSSTLVGTQPSTLLGYAATVSQYKNDDGTTRTVTTINDPTQAAAAIYSSMDVTFAPDGKMTYRSYAINRGDYGTPGSIIDTNFNYTGPNTFTYTEQSATPDTYAWLSHNDSVVNGNLASQRVFNKDGGVYQSNFGLDSTGVNRLMNVVTYNGSGGVAATTTYTYDSTGKLTSTTTK